MLEPEDAGVRAVPAAGDEDLAEVGCRASVKTGRATPLAEQDYAVSRSPGKGRAMMLFIQNLSVELTASVGCVVSYS